MSQLQVTGEAKIRDIQGPVVANNGVVTALDGAASQYVRGDGTLADFPTSTGGGSSVSYYLNSSVSQGTIGGVAYRQLSKEPIIGAGTDITISANGYVANYLTDANDPDVILVPGGNFNCEFYFSVNNNTGNPTTYAELYKYDGTTFTLLGSSVGVPESINQGTTIAPYYFAIPVATATLALTDRLAIRIYVNVDGRTVTLHTENSHLCQVVTTLSKGMVSLNNLTDQSQFITTGTSGTDFNIVSSGDTHTFNIPSASASNRGLITTGTQTISGAKTFSSLITGDAGIILKEGVVPSLVGYTGLAGDADGLVVTKRIGSTAYTNLLYFNSATSNTYTFPNLTGTLALLEGTQTFSGAKTFSTFPTTFDAESIFNLGFQIKKITTGVSASAGYMAMYSPVGTANKIAFLDGDSTRVSTLTFDTTGSFSYTFPASSGTIALTSNLSSYVPYTGATTNVDLGSNFLKARTFYSEGSGGGGSYAIKNGTTPSFEDGYTILSSNDYRLNIVSTVSAATKAVYFGFSGVTATRTYTLPDATGTIALTSNLSSYLPLSGGTLTGALNGTSITLTNDIYLENNKFLYAKKFSGATAFSLIGITPSDKVLIDGSGMGVNFGGTIGNGTYTYTLPSASGTLALTSDIPSLSGYVQGSGTTNYHAKFTGTSTIGNSMLTDDGTTLQSIGATRSNLYLRAASSSFYGQLAFTNGSNGSFGGISYNNSGQYMQFETNSSEWMRLYGNGNLRVFSSSATDNGAKFQVEGNTRLSGTLRVNGTDAPVSALDVQVDTDKKVILGGGYPTVSAGTYWGGMLYNGTQFRIESFLGNTPQNIVIASSGGNVGIGTSSPTCTLEVARNNGGSTGGQIALRNSSSSTLSSTTEISFLNDTGASASGTRNGRIISQMENVGNGASNMQFWTWSGSTDAERMRIQADGRINSTMATNNTNTHYIIHSGTSPFGINITYSGASPNSTGNNFIYLTDSTTARFVAQSNGGLANYQSNNVNLSDIRTKKDIIPLESYWNKFKDIEIVKFKYIDQTHDDYNIGVIAQQVELVAPEFIDVDGFGETPEDGIPYKTVYTSDLHHATIKVLQEAMAKIEQLEAKVTALENK